MTIPIITHIQHFQARLECSCNFSDSFFSEPKFFSVILELACTASVSLFMILFAVSVCSFRFLARSNIFSAIFSWMSSVFAGSLSLLVVVASVFLWRTVKPSVKDIVQINPSRRVFHGLLYHSHQITLSSMHSCTLPCVSD